MANVKCEKCGELGNSKCPHCRNVFASNQVLAIAEYSITELREEANYLYITIKLPEGTPAERLEHLRWVASQPEALLCKHTFTFVEGAESSIGCGHHG